MVSSYEKRSLLILPPPHNSTFGSLEAAYHVPLLTVLQCLSSPSTDPIGRLRLDVSLSCPHLYGQRTVPRKQLYASTQRLLAGIYRLICTLCAKNEINTEDPDGIDVRVLLLAHPGDGQLQTAQVRTLKINSEGPIIDIEALARCSSGWETVYSLETDAGEQLLRDFVLLAPSNVQTVKVRGDTVQADAGDVFPKESGTDTEGVQQKHMAVAVGGTFDHLHIGHKLLLSMTAFMLDYGPVDSAAGASPRSLTIGITGDRLLANKKFAEYLETWSSRQQRVDSYMRSIMDWSGQDLDRTKVEELSQPGPNGHSIHVTLPTGVKIKYVEIWDPFGPTITDEEISALVISAETRSGGAAVNQKREEKGWPRLEIFEVDVLEAAEESGKISAGLFEEKLSSTKIRQRLSEKTAGQRKGSRP